MTSLSTQPSRRSAPPLAYVLASSQRPPAPKRSSISFGSSINTAGRLASHQPPWATPRRAAPRIHLDILGRIVPEFETVTTGWALPTLFTDPLSDPQ
jgi:hypothetical protein